MKRRKEPGKGRRGQQQHKKRCKKGKKKKKIKIKNYMPTNSEQNMTEDGVTSEWSSKRTNFKEVKGKQRLGDVTGYVPLMVTQHNMGGLKRGLGKLVNLMDVLNTDVHVVQETMVKPGYKFPHKVKEKWQVISNAGSEKKKGKAAQGGYNHGIAVLVRRDSGILAERVEEVTMKEGKVRCELPSQSLLVRLVSDDWARPVYVHAVYVAPMGSKADTDGKEQLPTDESMRAVDEPFKRVREVWAAVKEASKNGLLITVGDWNTHLGQLFATTPRQYAMDNGENRRAKEVMRWMREEEMEVMNGRGGNPDPWTHQMTENNNKYTMDLAVMMNDDVGLHVVTSPMDMMGETGERFQNYFGVQEGGGKMTFAHRPVRTLLKIPERRKQKGGDGKKETLAPKAYDIKELPDETWEEFSEIVNTMLVAIGEEDLKECGALGLTKVIVDVVARALGAVNVSREKVKKKRKRGKTAELKRLLEAVEGAMEDDAAMEYFQIIQEDKDEELHKKGTTNNMASLYQQLAKAVDRTEVPEEMETKGGGTVRGQAAVANLIAEELGAKQMFNMADHRFERKAAEDVSRRFKKMHAMVEVDQLTELDKKWEPEEVTEALQAIRAAASSNPMGVLSNGILSNLAKCDGFIIALSILWDLIGIEGVVDDLWNKQLVVPIFKNKGTPRRAKYWRPIGLMLAMANAYLKGCDRRLRKWLFPAIGPQRMLEAQMAFRPGYRTQDPSMLLWETAVAAREQADGKKSVWCMYIDLSAAYHTTSRESLWLLMQKLTGGNQGDTREKVGRWLNGVWAVLKRADFRVRVRNIMSKEVETTQGNTEGNVLSPSMYIVQIDNLAALVKEEAEKQDWVGVKWQGLLVAILLFCDDIAIVSASEIGLSKTFDLVKKWLRTDRGLLAASKTKIMVFNEGVEERARRLETWAREPSPFQGPASDGTGDIGIYSVDSFKYVGTWMTWDLSPEIHLKKALQRARDAIMDLDAAGASPGAGYPLAMLVGVYEGVVVSRITPNSEVWARTRKVIESLQSFWMKKLKRLMQVPGKAHASPDRIAWVLGLDRLDVRLERKVLRYMWGLVHHREGYTLSQIKKDIWTDNPVKGGWGEWAQKVMEKWDFNPTEKIMAEFPEEDDWKRVINMAQVQRVKIMREEHLQSFSGSEQDKKLWKYVTGKLKPKEKLLVMRRHMGAGRAIHLVRHLCGVARIHGHDTTVVRKNCVLCGQQCGSSTVHYFGISDYSCDWKKERRRQMWKNSAEKADVFLALVGRRKGRERATERWPVSGEVNDIEVAAWSLGVWPIRVNAMKGRIKERWTPRQYEGMLAAKEILYEYEQYAKDLAEEIATATDQVKGRQPYGAVWGKRDRRDE